MEERLQVSKTRQMNSCIRCAIQKIKCIMNPNAPFGDCVNCVVSQPKFDIMIGCLRWAVTEAALFRLSPTDEYLWTRRWVGRKPSKIEKWNLPELKHVIITQDYGSSRAIVKVFVKEYSPQPGDVLDYKWWENGVEKVFHMPPFALMDVAFTAQNMSKYIDDFGIYYIQDIIDESNKILWNTFDIACRTAEVGKDYQKSIILDTLRQWVGCRLIEKPWRICGEDTFGITANTTDKASPYFDRVPVTPIMDTQLDQVVIKQILLPLKAKILQRLTALFKKNARCNWFTIYICTFILLHNYEIATSHDRDFAVRHNMPAYYSNYPLLEGFHAGAKTLLAYFHYICKGSKPFALDWKLKENAEIADLDNEQVEFMQFISDEVRQKDEEFRTLKSSKRYETDLYLASQMYEPNWSPGPTL